MTESSLESDAYVLFSLGEATYALPTATIRQLDMVGQVTPVPNALPHVAGIVSVRGQVLPAIELRTWFGLPPADRTLQSRILVLHVHGRTVGLIVDSAREFTRIPADSVQPAPEGIGGRSTHHLRGVAQVGERLVLVLDAHELLTDADDLAPAAAGVPVA